MRDISLLLLHAALCTIAVAMGFGIADFLGVPTYLMPFALLPAAYLIQRLFKTDKFSLMGVTVYFSLLGAAVWLAVDVIAWGSLFGRLCVAGIVVNLIATRFSSWQRTKQAQQVVAPDR